MLARIGDGLARERRFVADASHELRTPLALLKTELALRRARTTEELESAIRGAAEDTERLSRIADDLLLLARAEQGRVPIKREAVDVADVLETVAERFRPRARLEQRDLSVAPGDPLVCTATAFCSNRRSATWWTTHSATAQARSRSARTGKRLCGVARPRRGRRLRGRLPHPCIRTVQPRAEDVDGRERPRPGDRRDDRRRASGPRTGGKHERRRS